MTPQQFKEKLIKTHSPLLKICYFLGITNLEIIDNNVWKTNNDYNYKIREINPYNPLSYLVLLAFLPFALLFNGFNKDSFNSIKKMFIYR